MNPRPAPPRLLAAGLSLLLTALAVSPLCAPPPVAAAEAAAAAPELVFDAAGHATPVAALVRAVAASTVAPPAVLPGRRPYLSVPAARPAPAPRMEGRAPSPELVRRARDRGT